MFRIATSRKTEQPIEYAEGFAEFLGCKIDLSKRPFIPRPETEFLVEQAIEKINRSDSKFSFGFTPHPAQRDVGTYATQKIQNPRFHILDMFAGSGCMGIAILKRVPFARVDFAEKEKKFCEQIKINAKLNGINPKQCRVIQSDVFSKIKRNYDFIFANPPYLATARKRFIQESVLDWEPRSALFGGKDGLLYIRKFLKGAKNHLNLGGKIFMEFDSFQKPQITEILRSFNFCTFEFFRDQYKKWRYVVIE